MKMKFRKNMVIVEAMQFTNETRNQCFDWIECKRYPDFDDKGNPIITIETLEGMMWASLGDWIIKGVKNEFYPCKPDIFEATYEPIEELEGEG
jgi:hypothetical protein